VGLSIEAFVYLLHINFIAVYLSQLKRMFCWYEGKNVARFEDVDSCMYRLFTALNVVWQKSNETDFLLTVSFILFTNQGYPLQNSSLGQLHNAGGIVSIFCSSAGRPLLVYLSARRLRSSGYHPKYQNGALSIGF